MGSPNPCDKGNMPDDWPSRETPRPLPPHTSHIRREPARGKGHCPSIRCCSLRTERAGKGGLSLREQRAAVTIRTAMPESNGSRLMNIETLEWIY
jgi:hypothetical protein